jgi:tetratricopeptide (TPR) repeat protein
VFNDIGVAYSIASLPDSGLIYAQKAVNIDVENKDVDRIPVSVSTLAENYMAAKEYEIAIPFLRKSMAYYLSKKDNRNSFGIAYVNNDFAQAFLAIKQYDSANYYAYRAIEIAYLPGYKEQMLRSYEYLYKSFEETKRPDSVTKYFRLAMTTKDSLYSLEKTRSIETMHFHEEMRQQEMQTDRKKTEQARRENIQYALIALGIIAFFISFIMLSRRHITSTSVIQFLGVVALLLVFEFLNLLLHPFLERITNHSPVLILLALVCIAGMLVPLHRKLEHWTTHKLVEKNKAIRLASAKKTIEQLEKSNS